MIEISFFTGELLFTLLWLTVRAVVWIRRKKVDPKREAVLLLMFVNLAVIFRFTFFPFFRINGRVPPLVFDPDAILPFWINLTPLVHMTAYTTRRELFLNIFGNLALFVPSGVIYPLVYPKLDRFWKVALAGFGLSLCIELLQLLFAVRMTDVDDLILNTLGCLIGYGIYAAVCALFGKKAKT